jgi:hypothetical protein
MYPQKLALTSPTSGGRSVGIVRSRTKATEFSFFMSTRLVEVQRGLHMTLLNWSNRCLVAHWSFSLCRHPVELNRCCKRRLFVLMFWIEFLGLHVLCYLCNVVYSGRCLTTCCFYLQGPLPSYILNMNAMGSSETSVNIYHTTQCRIPQDCIYSLH